MLGILFWKIQKMNNLFMFDEDYENLVWDQLGKMRDMWNEGVILCIYDDIWIYKYVNFKK